jgi:hypothetical protein
MTPEKLIEPEWLLPFEGMSVGDSFFIPTLRPAELMYAVDCGAKRAGIRVKSFITVKNDMVGVRTWRLN